MAWMQRGIISFIILGLVMLGSCRLPPKPRIENTYYKNYEYEFKCKIPQGWSGYKDLPGELEKTVAGEFTDNFIFLLTNPETEGVIIITADTSDYDILTIGYNKDAFAERLKADLTANAAAFSEENGYKDYNNDIYPLQIAQGYGPTLIYSETATRTAGDQFVRAVLLNKCQEEETCEIHMTLITRQDTYDYNFNILSNLINSTIKVYQ